MKYLLILMSMFVLIITGCKDDSPTENNQGTGITQEDAALKAMKDNTSADVVTVMTRNIYIGADVDVVLEAETLEQVPILVAAAYGTLQETDFAKRAVILAKEIKKANPHLIGLQEVTQVYSQTPGDFLLGNPQEANTLEYDYLELLLDALAAEGMNYEVAESVNNANIELPMFAGFDNQGNPKLDDMRIVDRDVILSRSDVQISNNFHDNYWAVLPVDTSIGLVIPRGYVSVEAKVGNRSYRFVNTHLEAAAIEELRMAQAAELITVHAEESLPIILVGDFNAPAPTNQTYNLVLGAGYEDSWAEYDQTWEKNPDGNTWGHKADLSNESPSMIERIDFIFVKSPVAPNYGPVAVTGDESTERSGGLWGSDHAGVVTQLDFSTMVGKLAAH